MVATERRRMPLCLCVCVSTVNFSPLFSLNLILYCCLPWTQFFETPHEKLERLTKVCTVARTPSTVPKSAFFAQEKKELEEEIQTEGKDDVLAQRLATTIIQLKQCQEEVKSNVRLNQCRKLLVPVSYFIIIIESKELFSEAVKAGSVSVNMINTLIQGEAGVGKTSTKCILFNEPLPRFRTSTPLAEAPVQIRVECPVSQGDRSPTGPRDVQVFGVKVESAGSTWNRLDGEELERIVVEAISAINSTRDTDIQSHSVSSPHPRQVLAESSAVNRSPPKENQTNTSTVFHTSHADNGTNASEGISESTSESELQAAVASIYGQIVDLVGEQISFGNTNADEILGSNWIYFIDSGGQPHFHNLLPHFVHGISVALFVHRLSRKLEQYPMVEYYEGDQAIGEAYRSSLTTEDTLKCLVRSMQSHTIDDEKPKLVFIGTFLDKIRQSSETLVEKNEKLLKLLTPEFADQLIFCQGDLESLIFPLNAKSPSAHEGKMAELIRSIVESSPSRKVTIPIWWYVLEITLKRLSAHFDRMILSKRECLEVAFQLDISESALIEALKLFHKQHIFHYYPEILPDVVFTSPQVLLDKLTELVREVYSMKRSHSDFHAPKSGKWRIFRDQGILILEFLKRFKKHYVDNLFTPSDLLRIFMRHLIITPLSTEELHKDVDFTSNSIQYYMPCLLDMLSLTELDSHRNHSLVACPLLIRFPNGWPRAGVFCCLQIYLMQLLHWTLVLNRGKPKLFAQNCVMLSPPYSTCRVTLIDSFSYFEIHVKAESDVCRKMCPTILSQVLSGIDASCRTLRYNNDRPHLAFFCPCALATPSSPSAASDPPQHHAAELFEEEGSLRCTIDQSVTFRVDSNHSVWLQSLSKCT